MITTKQSPVLAEWICINSSGWSIYLSGMQNKAQAAAAGETLSAQASCAIIWIKGIIV